MWLPPVTDRTQQDVDFAKENRNRPYLLKGAQNYTDWNRISRNLYYLADVLDRRGFTIRLDGRQDWTVGGLWKTSDICNYREDLKQIRNAFRPFGEDTWDTIHARDFTWEQVNARELETTEYFSFIPIPELPYTHYEKINEFERLTALLESILERYGQSYQVSGTFGSGQVAYLPHLVEPDTHDMMWMEWDFAQQTWRQMKQKGTNAKNYFKGE